MTTQFRCRAAAVFAILCALFFIAPQAVHAEILYSENYGYCIDLPEAFTLEQQSEDERSLFFSHTILPVYFAIKVYDSGEYASSKEAISDVLNQLKAKGGTTSLMWNGRDSTLSNFSLDMPDKSRNEGWAASVAIPEKKAFITLLCYAPSGKQGQCAQFILSVIDSFIPAQNCFTKSGLITAFAYPGSKQKPITLTIGGKTIKTSVDAEDAEAAKFVVDREYAVLTLYANHNLWKEAWQRYYRMIYRDSYSRLNQVSADIYKALFTDAMKKDAANPERAYAQELLTWLQNFTYERAKTNKHSDFTDLISAVSGQGSDCDSRSMLLCALMKHIGTNATLYISREYSHSVAGLALEGAGAKITTSGTDFTLAETTAHVDIGRIAQDMSDTAKWIPVELP